MRRKRPSDETLVALRTRLDEAKAAVDKAIELLLPKPPDHQALALQAAIEEAIKERDSKKASEAPPATARCNGPGRPSWRAASDWGRSSPPPSM